MSTEADVAWAARERAMKTIIAACRREIAESWDRHDIMTAAGRRILWREAEDAKARFRRARAAIDEEYERAMADVPPGPIVLAQREYDRKRRAGA